MLRPGQVVGRYVVEDRLGAGGLALVYLVRHRSQGTRHALKVLSLRDPKVEDRFFKEGQLQAALRHANIVAVTEILPVGDTHGLVMEYVPGPTLDAWAREWRPGFADVEAIFAGILAGVRHAHAAGLIHRDLKPANILLAPLHSVASPNARSFLPKIADFGLARACGEDDAVALRTQTGVGLGTPAYMAPEQIRDARSVDRRADVFALGCILYELCCGQRAFPGDNLIDVYNAVCEGRREDPRRLAPGLPSRAVAAIEGCLQVDRGRRIPDCDVLESVLSGRAPRSLFTEKTEILRLDTEELALDTTEEASDPDAGRGRAVEPTLPIPRPWGSPSPLSTSVPGPAALAPSVSPQAGAVRDTGGSTRRSWLLLGAMLLLLLLVGVWWMTDILRS